VAANLCALYPHDCDANHAWAWNLLFSALRDDTWQEQVLDPIAHLLWPAPHAAHRFAEHNSTATWRFYNNRFTYVFNQTLNCQLCRLQHPLTPLDMLTTCNAPDVVRLRTSLGDRPHFTDRARALISTSDYDRLALKAINEPKCKTVEAAACIVRQPGDSAHEHEQNVNHVIACVVHHAAAVHADIWALVEDFVKANAHRRARRARARAPDDGEDDARDADLEDDDASATADNGDGGDKLTAPMASPTPRPMAMTTTTTTTTTTTKPTTTTTTTSTTKPTTTTSSTTTPTAPAHAHALFCSPEFSTHLVLSRNVLMLSLPKRWRLPAHRNPLRCATLSRRSARTTPTRNMSRSSLS
jgi:hypothetical protein